MRGGKEGKWKRERKPRKGKQESFTLLSPFKRVAIISASELGARTMPSRLGRDGKFSSQSPRGCLYSDYDLVIRAALLPAAQN